MAKPRSKDSWEQPPGFLSGRMTEAQGMECKKSKRKEEQAVMFEQLCSEKQTQGLTLAAGARDLIWRIRHTRRRGRLERRRIYKEHQGLPAMPEARGRAWNGFSQSLQSWERKTFCRFKPLSLWYFVSAATAKENSVNVHLAIHL